MSSRNTSASFFFSGGGLYITTPSVKTSHSSTTKPTNTEIKYIIDVDGQDRYFTAGAWANSDGTYAQSNTAAEINTNATALISTSSTLKIDALLNTTDDQVTPTLVSVTLTDVGDLVTGTD